MKKTRKLKLKKETVAKINDQALEKAIGGDRCTLPCNLEPYNSYCVC